VVKERTGGAPVGDGRPEAAVWFSYKTKDGRWLTIFPVGTPQLNELRGIVKDPALDDPKFNGPAGLVTHGAAFYEIVSRWTEARNFDEVWAALGTTTVPAGPINDIPNLLNDPHVKFRESAVTVTNAQGKPMTLPTVIPRLSPQPGEIRWTGEALGASNQDVYGGLLGMSDAEIADLKARGII
jgi:formyl-CoA transferase